MIDGGAREMNALLPDDVRIRGGETSGKQARESGRLLEAAQLGGQRSREIAEEFRRKQRGDT